MEYLGENKPVNQIDPLVSICVPTFQHSKYISHCLDSLLAQKVDFPFEILIGEDDSTDGTREICKKYAEDHPDLIRLFLRREQDKIFLFGRKAGRLNHLGLYRSARGEFICICDGDDWWSDPNKMAAQVASLREYPQASLCITNTEIEGDVLRNPPGLPSDFQVYQPRELSKIQYLGHLSSWMMRNRMDDLLKSPIVKKAVPLDMVLFTFYKLQGSTVYLPQETTVYRKNPTGVYRSQSSKKNHKARYRNNWYLFYYLHKNPIQLIRTMGYSLKRGYLIFLETN